MEEIYSNRKGKKCIIYIRVSSERQVKGYSLDGQKRYLTEWCEFEGMQVVEVYVEPGRSGKSISGREVFQKMLDDISSGKISVDYIVVFKLSRFGRNAKDLLVSLSYLQRYGVNLICKEDGLDSSTSMGRMMITILGAVAEMERENIIIQSTLGREEKARQGDWNGGPAPYGYELMEVKENGKKAKKKLVINEEEARIVRYVFDEYVNKGIGYSTIAAHLNRQGIPRVTQGRESFDDWAVQQIRRMLENPVYTGRVAFGRTRQERIEGTENEYRRVKSDNVILSDKISHEPIVSEELFEKAQALLHERGIAMAPKIGRGRKHILTGLLKCPDCGSTMYTDVIHWTNKDGTRREQMNYQCGHYAKSKNGNCRKNAIKAEVIESEVIAYTKQLVKNRQFAEDIQKQIGQKVDASEIDAEIATCRKRLKQLERSKSNLERDIDAIFDDDKHAERKRQDMNTRLNKLYEEIYDTEDQITACEQKKASIEGNALTQENIYQMLCAFDKLIDQMDTEDKKTVMQSLISEIQLWPKEVWKQGKRSPIKRIKYTLPISDSIINTFGENDSNVCLAVNPNRRFASRCKVVRS